MTTCTYCGTSYTVFQPHCAACGAALPQPLERAATADGQLLEAPPPTPRTLPSHTLRQMLSADAWAIAAGICALTGMILTVVGGGLTLAIVTAFVGLPFLGLGLLFLGPGVALLVWRYQDAQRTMEVLREGLATQGEVVSVEQNYTVRLNGRFPWRITYRYQVDGRWFEGRLQTFGEPDAAQRPGSPVYVLYARDDPQRSALYHGTLGVSGM